MKTPRIALGTIAGHTLFDNQVSGYLELAQMADMAGVDQIVFTDHVIMSENTDKYPFGEFPMGLDYPWYEPLTLLSSIAAVTDRIRLATGILISPLRPAALLAKTTATLDAISNGRLDLGIGVGWQKEEYDAQNMDFMQRMQSLDEQVAILQALWQQAPATVHNNSASIERLYSIPLATQIGGIPLWYGMAANAENAKRIAQNGTGWIPIRTDADFIRRGWQQLSRAFEQAGRDPADLQIRAHAAMVFDQDGRADLDHALAYASEQLEAGATCIEFELTPFCRHRDEIPAFLQKIVHLRH